MTRHRTIGSATALRVICAECLGTFALDSIEQADLSRTCPACTARNRSRPARPADAPERRAPRPVPELADSGLVGEIQAYCERSSVVPRLPLLALLAWWAWGYSQDVTYQPIIDGLNFGVHEFGHVLFGPLGMFMAILGGSLSQCLAPLIGVAMFLRQRDWFAVTFAIGWFGTNLFDVAVYVADARSQALQLVGLGAGEPIHDWNWLLAHMGLLRSDASLAGALRVGGWMALGLAIGCGGWLLVRMASSRPDGGRR
ncbi:hypothetical protein [Engelhardtia mirabilis]|uniref:Uncharacterized protein n=1 Tax=Engelhardtia mirabilis TaxID=2528011 RepID=A0A518BMF9_9BACT|nr:hypothetical protein Pla133_32580 [Planctomycetes bacterium Pla133]QDV02490.1 hypothetical protein Pla86_32570 [Planctomycetes bacterium Pla86]